MVFFKSQICQAGKLSFSDSWSLIIKWGMVRLAPSYPSPSWTIKSGARRFIRSLRGHHMHFGMQKISPHIFTAFLSYQLINVIHITANLLVRPVSRQEYFVGWIDDYPYELVLAGSDLDQEWYSPLDFHWWNFILKTEIGKLRAPLDQLLVWIW